MAGPVVQGSRSGTPRPIGSTDNGDGTDSLKVAVSGTAEANLDSDNDEVTVFGAEGSGGGTRRAVNVDASGRVRVVGAAGDGVAVAGDVAADSPDTGNPVKIGAKAVVHGAAPSAMSSGDRTNLIVSRVGIPWVIGGHPNVQTIRATYTTAQTDTAIVTIGAGSKAIITRVTVTLDEATTVGVQFRIGFGTASTPTTTGVVATHPGLVPGGGITVGDGSGMLGVGADNEDIRITSEVPTNGTLDCCITFYEVPS